MIELKKGTPDTTYHPTTLFSVMFPTNFLTREQLHGISVLEQAIPHFKELHQLEACFQLIDITTEGQRFFVHNHLSTSLIPRGSDWKWNQSRAKVELTSTDGRYSMRFFKLNTRKTSKNNIKVPQHKVWIFNITNTSDNMKTSFFWCERGFPKPTLDTILLRELSFLGPLVHPQTAIELGWKVEEPQFYQYHSERKLLPPIRLENLTSNTNRTI